ncbi:MAG: hypothetical protein QNJ84_16780 [Alphaproteobacteria bacterium]|nr:hypothetical protein [Alphaproteobacteria bacterium]
MSEPRQFSDEELTAYLDGEDALALRETIERSLAQDETLRARLDALTLDTARIRTGFAELLSNAPQAPEFNCDRVAPSPMRRFQTTWRHAAAAAVLALFVGFGGGALLTGPAEPGWRDYVASYHALYATVTLSGVGQTTADAAAELERVSAAIEKPISLSDVSMPDRLDYKRAQILSFEGRPLVQLAFLTKQGTPVALCIIEASEPGDGAVQTTRLEGMSAAYWSKGGHAFVVIGGDDDAFIGQLAAVYSERL